MKAMFEGGPYDMKVLDIPTASEDTSWFAIIGELGNYERVGTNEVGLAMFKWITEAEPSVTT